LCFDLAERVQCKEIRLLVGAGHEVDLDELMGNAEQRGKEAGTVGVARERVVMELHVGVLASVGGRIPVP